MLRDITDADPGRPGRALRVLVTAFGLLIIAATLLAVAPLRLPPATAAPTPVVPIRSLGLLAATTPNYSTAWLITGGRNSAAQLWKTSDSGVSWSSLPLPIGGSGVVSVQLVDPDHAYLVSNPDSPLLSISSDGGRHWRSTALPYQPGASLTAITFTHYGQGRALYTGSGSARLEQTYFYASEDGIDWRLLAASDSDPGSASGLGQVSSQSAMAFADDLDGIIAPGDAGVYVTHDGGSSWSFSPLGGPPGERPLGPDSVTAAAVNGAYLVGTAYKALGTPASGTPAAAFVYRSSDEGSTWSSPIEAPTQDGYLAPVFAPSSSWWIAGGNTVSESDGHGAWIQGSVPLGRGTRFTAIFPFDDRRAWAFAGDVSAAPRLLYATTDGGTHWSLLKPPA